MSSSSGPETTEPSEPTEGTQASGQVRPMPSGPPRWLPWLVPAAVVVGLLIGGAVAFGLSDPEDSDEYRSVAAQLTAAQSRAGSSEREAQVAAASSRSMEAQVIEEEAALAASSSAKAGELAMRESAVASREAAVGVVEQSIAANSIGEGTWTVGRDVQPGTYRASQPVRSNCYWAITRSGTNGSDIVENDIPGGGFPTVTLSEGQDFTNARCGTFVRQ